MLSTVARGSRFESVSSEPQQASKRPTFDEKKQIFSKSEKIERELFVHFLFFLHLLPIKARVTKKRRIIPFSKKKFTRKALLSNRQSTHSHAHMHSLCLSVSPLLIIVVHSSPQGYIIFNKCRATISQCSLTFFYSV